jgi:large subunit ribosomal protein L23
MLKPIRTEKSMKDASLNRYTFSATKLMRKPEIKAWVEKAFGVTVLKVHTSVMPGKAYRAGRRGLKNMRQDFKKAIVTIKKDQKIDLFEVTS